MSRLEDLVKTVDTMEKELEMGRSFTAKKLSDEFYSRNPDIFNLHEVSGREYYYLQRFWAYTNYAYSG